MALAVATLVARIRSLLGDEPVEDIITADPSTNATVSVGQPFLWLENDVMEFSDGELAKIQRGGANPLDVKRGHDGTTAAAHTASGATAIILKNPVYRYTDIQRGISATILGLWPYAWKKSTASITPNTTSEWFDLASATDYRGLITATQRYGSSDEMVGFFSKGNLGHPIRIEGNLPTALVTSGWGVRFPNGFFHASNAVTVNYRSALTATVSGSDYSDLSDGLLAETVAYGACSHILSGADIRRLREDLDPRETLHRAGDERRTASWFEAQFRDRRSQLETELRGSIPPARRWVS